VPYWSAMPSFQLVLKLVILRSVRTALSHANMSFLGGTLLRPIW